MPLKETKSPQEIIHEMKTEERGKAQEIEMEGATIKGAMPTFKNLTKRIVHPANRAIPNDTDEIRNPSGQIFTLPNGKEIVLVPEDEISEFLYGDDVIGKDSNEAREWHNEAREWRGSGFEEDRQRLRGQFGGRIPPSERGGGVDPRRVLVPDAANARLGDDFPEYEGRFPVHHLGGGFFVLLGVEQQYQPDKSSFGTYEMTADGPVRVDDGEPTTKSIPIVFYSDPNKPIEYETLKEFDEEKAKRGLPMEYEKAYYPSLGMNLLSSPRTTRKRAMGTYDTGKNYFNVSKSEIKPELIPDFTGRDVIEGYKTAKAASRSTPPREVKPPREIKPAPPPEPAPEPPSSFQGFEMPVVDTLKGRRRKAKRRFSERQELTDE